MSTQVVVTLPDDLYAHAQHWAALTHREVSQLLSEALALILTPIGTPPVNAPPVATLSDTEVLGKELVLDRLPEIWHTYVVNVSSPTRLASKDTVPDSKV